MASKYVVSGYATPQGVNSKDAVKQIQAQLGVKADGVWGRDTQAAYDRQQYNNQIAQIQNMIGGMGGVGVPSVDRGAMRAEIEAALRPTYDSYIEARKKQTQTNRGEIDVDAASRGLSRSTWVTDAKSRQMDAEADDIAGYESQYAAALSGAVNDAAASQQALGLQAAQMAMAGRAQQAQLLMQLLQMQQQYQPTYTSSGRSSGGGSYGGAVDAAIGNTYTPYVPSYIYSSRNPSSSSGSSSKSNKATTPATNQRYVPSYAYRK